VAVRPTAVRLTATGAAMCLRLRAKTGVFWFACRSGDPIPCRGHPTSSGPSRRQLPTRPVPVGWPTLNRREVPDERPGNEAARSPAIATAAVRGKFRKFTPPARGEVPRRRFCPKAGTGQVHERSLRGSPSTACSRRRTPSVRRAEGYPGEGRQSVTEAVTNTREHSRRPHCYIQPQLWPRRSGRRLPSERRSDTFSPRTDSLDGGAP